MAGETMRTLHHARGRRAASDEQKRKGRLGGAATAPSWPTTGDSVTASGPVASSRSGPGGGGGGGGAAARSCCAAETNWSEPAGIPNGTASLTLLLL